MADLPATDAERAKEIEGAFRELIKALTGDKAAIGAAATSFIATLASGPLAAAVAATGAVLAARKLESFLEDHDATKRLLALQAQLKGARLRSEAREQLRELMIEAVSAALAKSDAQGRLLEEALDQFLRRSAAIHDEVRLTRVLVGRLERRTRRSSLPPTDRRLYRATPYEKLSRAESLATSVIADEKFAGDTIDEDVVQTAIESGCGIGLRLSDPEGRIVGFLDVFRLRPEALEPWIAGSIPEASLTPQDFLPIPPAGQRSGTLELIVGALCVQAGRDRDLLLSKAFVDAARDYFETRCAGFDEMILYATIFRGPGRRWAEHVQFAPKLRGKHRGEFGARHDVYSLSVKAPRARELRMYEQASPDCFYAVVVDFS